MPFSSKRIVDFANRRTDCVRDLFPAIRDNPDAIYFDNAATTQVPEPVLRAVQDYYVRHAANPGRGSYDWAEEAGDIVSQTRESLSALTGLHDPGGVIFTGGTTMSLNMVAQCWGRHNLSSGDEILLCLSDHHSMVLPWEELTKEMGLVLRPYRLHANGSINLEDLSAQITERTKLCCVTHVNNTAGWINDLYAIRKLLPEDVMLNVDAAQSISHVPLNMAAQGIDFLSFSGHKMFALGGIGALCVSARGREQLRPLFFGGGMAEYKSGDPVYQFMEAGTLNMAGIVAMQAACRFVLERRGNNPLPALTQTLYKRLLANPRLDLIYEQKPYALERLSGIASFTLEGMDSGELADILAEHDIFTRAGRHCAGAADSVRISLQLYNTEEEIERACSLLADIGEKFY